MTSLKRPRGPKRPASLYPRWRRKPTWEIAVDLQVNETTEQEGSECIAALTTQTDRGVKHAPPSSLSPSAQLDGGNDGWLVTPQFQLIGLGHVRVHCLYHNA